MKTVVVSFFIGVLMFGCKPYIKELPKDDVNVASIESDDAEMNAAIDSARATFQEFTAAWASGDSGSQRFAVKQRFDWGEQGGEHMWMENLFFKNDSLYGVLSNEPVNVTGISYGDTLLVEPDRLSDWYFIKQNRLHGGYTLKLLYRRASEKEKLYMESELGVKIQ